MPEVKETYTVTLVALIPPFIGNFVQMDLEPEGAKANPRPIPQTDEDRHMAKMFEAISKAGVPVMGIPGMPGGPTPHCLIIVRPEVYRELGSPAVGKKIELTVSLVD